MKKTKICFFSYPHYRIPPLGYGPIQNVINEIVIELSKSNSFDITVFATGDSSVPAKIIPIKETSDVKDETVPDVKIYEFLAIGELLRRKDDFDLISSHVGFHLLPFAEMFSCPLIVNLQGDYSNLHYIKLFEKYKKSAQFVTVSNFQRSYLPDLNYAANIYHGVDIDNFVYYKDAPRNSFVFIGRTDPKKGLGDAVEATVKTGSNLIIGARETPAKEAKQYFEDKVKPYIDNKKIKFLGEVDAIIRNKLMSESTALIFPSYYNEAFGLVMIEAMACGTPVIAYKKGPVPEIVEDGKTGFLVEEADVKGIAEAIKKINKLTQEDYSTMRNNCRKRVEEKFTSKEMVKQYIKLYNNLLGIPA